MHSPDQKSHTRIDSCVNLFCQRYLAKKIAIKATTLIFKMVHCHIHDPSDFADEFKGL